MKDKEFMTGLLAVIHGESERLLQAIKNDEEITTTKADGIREAAVQLYQTISQQTEETSLIEVAHSMLKRDKSNIDEALLFVIEQARERGASD